MFSDILLEARFDISLFNEADNNISKLFEIKDELFVDIQHSLMENSIETSTNWFTQIIQKIFDMISNYIKTAIQYVNHKFGQIENVKDIKQENLDKIDNKMIIPENIFTNKYTIDNFERIIHNKMAVASKILEENQLPKDACENQTEVVQNIFSDFLNTKMVDISEKNIITYIYGDYKQTVINITELNKLSSSSIEINSDMNKLNSIINSINSRRKRFELRYERRKAGLDTFDKSQADIEVLKCVVVMYQGIATALGVYLRAITTIFNTIANIINKVKHLSK